MGWESPEWREEKLAEQFYNWELRGRGWQVFDAPVSLEPPFRPFSGHFLPAQKQVDDGRRQTFVSGLLARFRQDAPEPESEEAEIEPEPEFREVLELTEFQMSLPRSRSVPAPQVESFLRHVCRTSETLAIEILGTERETVPQFVASPPAATRLERAVESCFPGIVCTPAGRLDNTGEALSSAWRDSESNFAVAELGLNSEFMLPLGNPRCDLLTEVVSAMDGLEKKELALFQVLFEPVQNSWGESVIAAVCDREGKPFFANRPELLHATEQKLAAPLFAVVIRLAACAGGLERAWEIISDMASPLSALSRQGSNFLLPLNNDGYPASYHEEDILNRMSRRCGMLLNLEELIPLLTPPVTSASRKLRRETKRTNAAPDILTNGGTLSLGLNTHAGTTQEVFLSPEHRVRHTHVIGASGFGKTTFLESLIVQDIERGEGLAVLDPHGDLIDSILEQIPPHRTDDVILLDPSDKEYAVGLNILTAHSDFERSLLASDLTSVFRRLSTSWGDQMETVLRNAILAFLESSRGGTIADLYRFLLDAAFRKEFLRTVTDPKVIFYWTKAFPLLTGGKSVGPLLTRLDEFLSEKPICNMVSQAENRVLFSEVLDEGRILLVKLPQGLIGRENAALLGSLVITKLQMAAMSRQRIPTAERRDFWCYLDESQFFFTPSMAEILAGARKYRMGLILAHQELRHLEVDRDVEGAVLANCCTRVVFKVGDADARALESGFSHFEAQDLMNLGTGEAVCRVERSDFDFNLSVPKPELMDADTGASVRENVIAVSRARYARWGAEGEAEILQTWQIIEPEPAKPQAAPTSPPVVVPKASEPAPLSEMPKDSEATKPMPEFGRGGEEHREIQQRVKEVAEKLGFRAVIEKTVLDGAGHVDVSVERGEQKIACEISVTTKIEHESANTRKCLNAGYDAVIMITQQKNRLIELAKTLESDLSEEEMGRVHVCSPNGVGMLLKRLIPKETEKPTQRQAGYKIKRKYQNLPSADESRAIETEFLHAIARALRGEENRP